MTGLSRATIYALIARGKFSKPIKLTEHASGWPLEAVEAWARERIAASQ